MRSTIARAATRAATFLVQMHRTRRNALMLSKLTDAELKDIGLTRSDIPFVASGRREHFAD